MGQHRRHRQRADPVSAGAPAEDPVSAAFPAADQASVGAPVVDPLHGATVAVLANLVTHHSHDVLRRALRLLLHGPVGWWILFFFGFKRQLDSN